MSLFCLDLLQQELFRRSLRDTNFTDLLDRHLYNAWLQGSSKAGIGIDSDQNQAVAVAGHADEEVAPQIDIGT